MLDMIFLKLCEMSKIASFVIIVVLLTRLFIKRAPKVFFYALWSVVLFRLLCPVSIEAPFSWLPEPESTVQSYTPLNESVSPPADAEPLQENIGNLPHIDPESQYVPIDKTEDTGIAKENSMDWRTVWKLVTKSVWLAGMTILILYSTVSLVRLKRKLIGAVLLKDNIYLADYIDSPFVMGLFRPKIYLPTSLSEREREYIILHEQHHIKRGDHIIKLVSFLALCLHCFNPFVWIAFILSGKDMEMSCDEAVLRKMGDGIRADYSASLLSLATGKRIIAGAPLAFGEGNTKGRIKNIANWKKPAIWVIVSTILVTLCAVICLITNPMQKNTLLLGAEYRIAETLYSTGDTNFTDSDLPTVCITADYVLWERNDNENKDWRRIGQLKPYALTKKELDEYTPSSQGWRRKYNTGEITDAYILRDNSETASDFFLTFYTKKGDVLLGYGSEDASQHDPTSSAERSLLWLCRLESTFGGTNLLGEFHERSITETVGGDVSVFHTWFVDKNYTVVGFKSDKLPYTEGVTLPDDSKTDLGFAVFYHDKKKTGYRLVDCHVYENAVFAKNGIFLCSDAAVLSLDGKADSKNTYDVLLLNNDQIAKAVREWTDNKGKTKTESHSMLNGHELVMLSRKNLTSNCIVRYYFYDEHDNLIHEWNGNYIQNFAYVKPWVDLEPLSETYNWDINDTVTLTEFPDAVFRITREEITAEVNGESIHLIGGMPIWNAYFTDLNGDGYPEICASVSFGSGIIDEHIEVYDYKNGKSYTLWDRMQFDYSLFFENGRLFCKKRPYNSFETEEIGLLAMENDSLVILPFVEAYMSPTTANVTGAFDNYLFIPLNGNTFRYERTDDDPEKYKKSNELYSFTEKEFDTTTEWRVYAVEESPSNSIILAEADWETAAGTEKSIFIYKYSPPKASSPTALEEAKAKGLTVMEDGFATTGQKQWDEFYKKVQEGTAAHISIAYYYTLSPKTSNTLFTDYYEANKEDYPLLYTRNLFFDGEKFTLTLEDNGSFIRREYGYLKQFETTIPSSYSSKFPETAIYYVLVNDSTASWDDLMMGAFSSQMGDYIPFDIVYCEKE